MIAITNVAVAIGQVLQSDWAIGVIWALLSKVISIGGLTLQKSSHNMESMCPETEGEEADEMPTDTDEGANGDNNLERPLAPQEPARRHNSRYQYRICCCSVSKKRFWLAVGLILYVGSQPFNVLALTFAPITIIAPLGSVEVIVNLFMSWFFLSEPFTKTDIFATFLCCASSIGVVTFGPHVEGQKDFPADNILFFWRKPECLCFVIFSFAAFVASVIVIFRCCDTYEDVVVEQQHLQGPMLEPTDGTGPPTSPTDASAMARHNPPSRINSRLSLEAIEFEVTEAVERVRTNRCSGQEVMAYPVIVSVFATWSNLFAKAFGMEIRNGVAKQNIPEFVIIIVLLALLSLSSLSFVTRAISVLDNRFFIPAFFAVGTLMAQIQGAIFFNEMKHMHTQNIIIFTCFCLGSILSVCMINSKSSSVDAQEEGGQSAEMERPGESFERRPQPVS